MAFQFPWTNLHELNLDWFLSKFKQFTDNFLGTTATAESVPYGTQPSVTVTGGELDDDTDIVDPFTFNFKIPAGQQGEQGEQGVPGVPGRDGFSPTATVTKSGTVATITITDANGTTTTTISDGEVTQAQLDTKAPAILSTASGLIANFSDGADDMPMSDLVVDITPIQSGSGDPAPDNIRPISGWTGVNVMRTGVNIWDEEWEVGSLGNNGEPIPGDNNTIRSKNYIPCMPETEYCIPMFSNQSGAYVYGVYQYDAEKNHISFVSINSYTKIFTTAPNAYYLKFRTFVAYGTTYNHDISINYPASDTEYHAYQGQTVSLSWQTEAGTVYGGTIDVATGLLTVDKTIVDISTLTWATHNTYGFYSGGIRSTVKYPSGNTIPVDGISSIYKTVPLNQEPTTDYSFAVDSTGMLYIKDSRYSTTTELITASSGVTICYPLATPQTYQLTPQQLFNTLYGVNNVWSNAGDSTVTYPSDTKLYIEQLTQPAEDDMVANTAIPNGKFFMIGNNLYRASTAIASGSQIIPGTNATPMSLADALNLL